MTNLNVVIKVVDLTLITSIVITIFLLMSIYYNFILHNPTTMLLRHLDIQHDFPSLLKPNLQNVGGVFE